MSVYTALKHRATVHRSTRTFEDGRAIFTWDVVAENVPCLLDAAKRAADGPEEFAAVDRAGSLMTGPGSPIQTGDRIQMTRGASGTFTIADDPDLRLGFHGVSHKEHVVSEVA